MIENKQKVEIVVTVLTLGFVIAVFYHFGTAVFSHSKFAATTFLFNPDDMFNDLFNALKMNADFNPYERKPGLEPAVYFPFMYIFLYILQSTLTVWGCFYFFIISLLLFILSINYSALKQSHNKSTGRIIRVFALTLLTYPILFVIDRGNVEGFLFIVLFTSMWLFYDGFFKLSAVFLGMAIAMKGYPAIFLILLLKKKKYKETCICIAFAGMLTILGLCLLGEGIKSNLVGLIDGLNYFKETYVYKDAGAEYDSSLFGTTKLILSKYSTQYDVKKLNMLFSILSIFLFSVLSTYICLYKKWLLWQQVTLLVIFCLLFLSVTPVYKLLLLYMPLYLFFIDTNSSKYDSIYAVLFGLSLIPKQYWLGCNQVVEPLVLLALALLLLNEHKKHSIAYCMATSDH